MSLILKQTSAGAVWVPRLHVPTNTVHWFYEPRLREGVWGALAWCRNRTENRPASHLPNADLSAELDDGVPCQRCNERWTL